MGNKIRCSHILVQKQSDAIAILDRIKKGENIRLVESFRDGRIFKVELLKEKSRRDHYFIELESLRSYNLIKTDTASG